MDPSGVPATTLVRVSPSEHYDAINMLLAEMARIKLHLGVDVPRDDPAEQPNGKKIKGCPCTDDAHRPEPGQPDPRRFEVSPPFGGGFAPCRHSLPGPMDAARTWTAEKRGLDDQPDHCEPEQQPEDGTPESTLADPAETPRAGAGTGEIREPDERRAP